MSYPVVDPSFADQSSFQNANRGHIASLHPCIIKGKDGQDVWNNEEYSFLQGDCPATVNPKLWRQGQLTSIQGLFEVTDGIYQIRGFDISNMTLIEGKTGVMVLDCLQSTECAEKALEFYRSHRGNRPVTAVLYTHCHYDHFSGALGVLPSSPSARQDIPIIAPAGFMEEVLKEKVVVGPAMLDRAVFMFGESLPKGPKGHVGCGLGIASSKGTRSLVPPNDTIYSTGETRTIDGVKIIFQMVSDSEAPSEFNLFFPEQRALCIAECATHAMHNIVTLRGAAVRDAKQWSKYLDETITLYAHDSKVLFSGHHWPTWGTDEIIRFVSDQRDLYAYMHDQTVRLMNLGLTGIEIAEKLRLPQSLQRVWYAREYYGALSQNVKGIYQRYMTWFDGNPANLWKHTPIEEAKRYVTCMGGVNEVIRKAKEFSEQQDIRFAITLLDHAVSAEPENTQAREQLARNYETLAFGAENAVWRNFYLTEARQLKASSGRTRGQERGRKPFSISPTSPVEDWLDALALQLDGLRACEISEEKAIVIDVPEQQTAWKLRLRNAALTFRSQPTTNKSFDQPDSSPDLVATMGKEDLFKLLTQGQLEKAGEVREESRDLLRELLDLCGIKIGGSL